MASDDHARNFAYRVAINLAKSHLRKHLRGQRACVVLVDHADMHASGAARVLGMGAGTVRVHLMRGRRGLRERLGEPAREEPQ